VGDATERWSAAVLQGAPEAIVCAGPDGCLVLANAAAEQLFGYRPGELAGLPADKLLPGAAPLLADLQDDSDSNGTSGGTGDSTSAGSRNRWAPRTAELTGHRRDGGMFIAEVALSAAGHGADRLVTAVIRDLTQRRPREGEAGLVAAIVASAQYAVISKTLDQIVTSWNPAAERIYGWTAEEMIGQSIRRVVPESESNREVQTMAAALRGERVDWHQVPRVRKDGTTITVALTMSPLTNAAGEITGVSTVTRDLTEQQRAQARFTGLLDAAPDAMVCVETDGRIALVNAAAERLFGYRREELVGLRVEVLVPDEARLRHPEHRERYVTDPQPRPMGGAGMELAGRRRNGSTFPAEISLSAIETDEGTLITAAVRDVTERLAAQAERERLRTQVERERLERQVHQSQRLESLGQLAGGVAHDFNNLLGVISGYSAFVADEAQSHPAGDGWQGVRDDIEQVQHAAERAARLTHQLLAFARREVVQPRVLNLNEVVESMLRLLQRTLGEHIEIITQLGPGLDAILADVGQAEQVIVNLALNARDAMPGGGRLTIETSNTEVDEAYAASRSNLSSGRYVALRVSDNGTGMTRDVAYRAFEPFFTTKPKGEGTGLGLATIYGIVVQAGGNVRIYSELGLGTTVTVLLPVTGEPSGPAGAFPEEAARGGSERVLVVEDEPAMREVTRRILAANGYQVTAAASGAEAIAAVKDSPDPLDVLVTDVVMPGMQGREVAERITALQPGIAVLFMSGYTEGLLSGQGVLDPGINLIEKPFTEAALLGKLRGVLHTGRGTPA
jgi:two-component system, cell cycle sensor histidine kinase and response regulator CckA